MDKRIMLTKYRETIKDVKVITSSIVITILVAWLFYRSFLGLIIYPVVLFCTLYYFYESNNEKKREKVLIEFREMLKIICSELRSGHSLENAVMILDKEIIGLYGEKAYILSGIKIMQKELSLKKPVEQAISDFASYYQYEEIINFAYTISYAKRLGGNYIKNIQNTAEKIEERLEVKQQINTKLTEKQLEMKIMGVMPLGILIYIGLTAYEFIEPLYHNVIGIIVMSVSLVLYVACLYVAKKIVTIEY
ncbi:MAG TPA: hypothetical protein DCR12_06040 [Lachnospiraceae bacterium]|nr:hypothetical protein [Lachnospiraceae bacterium]